jgi:hypothetical protein
VGAGSNLAALGLLFSGLAGQFFLNYSTCVNIKTVHLVTSSIEDCLLPSLVGNAGLLTFFAWLPERILLPA